MKRVLIINGHPDVRGFSTHIAEAYKKGAEQSGATVELINLRELTFDPNLQWGYREIYELEPDLVVAQKSIKEADHIVVTFPTWWSSMPALLKGFIDRTILPGFAFKYHEGKMIPEKLLKGKTAHLITTMGSPFLLYKFIFKKAGLTVLGRGVFGFTGVKVVTTSTFGLAENASNERKDKFLARIERSGKKLK